jgi:hypothetical protein
MKLALTLAVVAATYWVGGHLMLTETESLAERFFFIRDVKPGEKFPRWSYVTFGLSHPHFKKGKKELLTKMVRCEAGETLKVTDQREYFCNGQFLGRSFERDSKGVALPQFRYSGPIPPGKLFVMGQHERSFDGRYFGLIDEREVVKVAYPLF